MELRNFTGRKIGLTNPSGNPIEVLPSHGLARVEVSLAEAKVEDKRYGIFEKEYSKVKNLPDPDPNYKILYIVTKEIAEAIGNFRLDLLVPEDPFPYEGATFYRKLIKV